MPARAAVGTALLQVLGHARLSPGRGAAGREDHGPARELGPGRIGRGRLPQRSRQAARRVHVDGHDDDLGLHLHALSVRHGPRPAAEAQVGREAARRGRTGRGGAPMARHDADAAVAAAELCEPAQPGQRGGRAGDLQEPGRDPAAAGEPRTATGRLAAERGPRRRGPVDRDAHPASRVHDVASVAARLRRQRRAGAEGVL